MRPVAVFAACAIGLVVFTATGAGAGLKVNTTPSLPMGIWRVSPGLPARGQIALVCPPDDAIFRGAHRAGYIGNGNCAGGLAPLLKPVAAIAGDRVEITPTGVVVNGRLLPNTKRMRFDGSGRELPPLSITDQIVPPGAVWLLSSYNRASFDSRYFGPLPTSRVKGVARPLLIKGSIHD